MNDLFLTVAVSVTITLLLVISVLIYVFGLGIIRYLRKIVRFYEETPNDASGNAGIDLMLLKPKVRGHKTRKPTDRSREWMENRARESREVK